MVGQTGDEPADTHADRAASTRPGIVYVRLDGQEQGGAAQFLLVADQVRSSAPTVRGPHVPTARPHRWHQYFTLRALNQLPRGVSPQPGSRRGVCGHREVWGRTITDLAHLPESAAPLGGLYLPRLVVIETRDLRDGSHASENARTHSRDP